MRNRGIKAILWIVAVAAAAYIIWKLLNDYFSDSTPSITASSLIESPAPATSSYGYGGGSITPASTTSTTTTSTTTTSSVRTITGSQAINVSDSTPSTLTVPANTNLAEIQVQGGDAYFTINTAGTLPTNGRLIEQNGTIELESLAEITAFQIMAVSGSSVKIVIDYFNLPSGVVNS